MKERRGVPRYPREGSYTTPSELGRKGTADCGGRLEGRACGLAYQEEKLPFYYAEERNIDKIMTRINVREENNVQNPESID